MAFIDGTRECGTISAASSTGQCAHRSRSFAVLSNFRHDRFPNGRTDWQWASSQIRASKEWIMTIRNELDTLRTFAKRLARKHRIPHHSALDIIAMQYGHPHWNALMKAWDKGWRPAPHELTDINEPSVTESPIRGVGFVSTSQGVIAGEPYTLEVGFDDVLIGGNGWQSILATHRQRVRKLRGTPSPILSMIKPSSRK